MGQPRRCLEERLSELADYRKIHGHCNVPASTAKQPIWEVGLNPRAIQSCTKMEDVVYDHLPNSGIGNLGFRMGQPRRRLG
jgi:hypothetical protein